MEETTNQIIEQNKSSVIEQTTPKKKPYNDIRVGNIVFSFWRNQTKEGKEFTNITIKKNFKDKEGNWKSVSNFNKNDLSSLSFACIKAFNELE